jgi:hypothetical protein
MQREDDEDSDEDLIPVRAEDRAGSFVDRLNQLKDDHEALLHELGASQCV